jgi:hypothetical protein
MTAIRQRARVKADGSIEVRSPALIEGAEVDVIVIVPGSSTSKGEPYAFLTTLEGAALEGPPDWSENFEDYIHGSKAL